MEKLNFARYYIHYAILIVGSFILLRLFFLGWDITCFSVCGSKFTQATETPVPMHIIPGDGYDGQFFTRYAFNPFSVEKTAYGIEVDEPLYRKQRVLYPLLVFLLSFGQVSFVPYVMVLLNALAFIGIIIGFHRIIKHLGASVNLIVYPFLIFGLYMSLARNLSEILELCLYTWMFLALLKSQSMVVILLASLTLFTRETSLISVFPILAASAWMNFREKKMGLLILHVLPFLLFACWRLYLQQHILASSNAAGYQHLGMPLAGIWQGLMLNINFSTPVLSLATLFYIAYLIWQICFSSMAIATVKSCFMSSGGKALLFSYALWFLLAVFFNHTVWIDDWGFVRIFALWNMGIILMLAIANKPPNKYFLTFSFMLLSLTFARLLIRI